jgi:hypothetical protein
MDIVHPETGVLLYQRSRDGPLPASPDLAFAQLLVTGKTLDGWRPQKLRVVHPAGVIVREGKSSDFVTIDLAVNFWTCFSGPEADAKAIGRMKTGGTLQGQEKVLQQQRGGLGGGVCYKIQLKTGEGWVSRDHGTDGTLVVASAASVASHEEDLLPSAPVVDVELGQKQRRELLSQAVLAACYHAPRPHLAKWLDSLLVAGVGEEDDATSADDLGSGGGGAATATATATATAAATVVSAAGGGVSWEASGVEGCSTRMLNASSILDSLIHDHSDNHTDDSDGSSGGGGGMCGYLFKHGDMAWNCRTCQVKGRGRKTEVVKMVKSGIVISIRKAV